MSGKTTIIKWLGVLGSTPGGNRTRAGKIRTGTTKARYRLYCFCTLEKLYKYVFVFS